ncbi:SgcJ/EcaC family oxidoreductase [Nocardia puris]|uniref:Uncharacterized protein (TIGR02246 family) n=1 Tax=Nocardia puris TaxID=208602 RepID=A0A366DBL9_9NOCA|nr:SgcJ/EcaC family oxidoreductase [Nocardia puris]RBO87462.1 uncharacterized protein (TIGR02246 family) [Nocardia puris]
MSVSELEQTRTTPSRTRRRHWPYVVAGVAGVAIAAGLGGYVWLTATSTVSQRGAEACAEVPGTAPNGLPDPESVAGVCATITGLTSAWAEHDAEAYGALFTEDATYTTFVGTYYSGRADIVDSHRALFAGPLDGTRLADRYLSLRFPTEDVAILVTRGDTYEGDPPATPGKVQTYTLVRDGDTWRVASFHNSQRGKLMERIQFLLFPDSRPAAER